MSEEENTYVVKRNGTIEELNPDKITRRVRYLIHKEPVLYGLNPVNVMLKVTSKLHQQMSTCDIDEFTAEQAANMSVRENPNYLELAARISIDNHQKQTLNSFFDKMQLLYLRKDVQGKPAPLISKPFMKFVETNKNFLEKLIDYSLDFNLTYFGFKTLLRSYLMKDKDKIIERPQDMFLRVAVQIHMVSEKDPELVENALIKIAETYLHMANTNFTHASPTLFNAGTNYNQMSSCFLLSLNDGDYENKSGDSLDGIMDTAKNCARISKRGGGIGVDISSLRSEGSLIRSTNGHSGGSHSFLPIYDAVTRGFNQGGKRKGSFAFYDTPLKADFRTMMTLKLPETHEDIKTPNLFFGAWIPDLFMERVANNQIWSFFDPDQHPELYDSYGDKFKRLYEKLEKEKQYISQMKARDLWHLVYIAKSRKSTPYICFSDTVNRLSNHINLGVIRCSNLCTEIMEFSNLYETAVCNLASICLSQIITDSYSEEESILPEQERRHLNHQFPVNPKVDLIKLMDIVRIIVRNLNNIIDKNHYPTIETERSNFRHRPIGIGVQGLWDMFMKMRYPFDSPSAKKLNKIVFEAMYYSALSESTKLSRENYLRHCKNIQNNGYTIVKVYSNPKDHLDKSPADRYFVSEEKYTSIEELPKTIGSYPSMLWNGGSPISKGIFHWELFGLSKDDLCGKFDWETLRNHIKTFGVVNSLLLAPMPTASTSQIMGNNECIEPITSNLYRRKVLAGSFEVINKYLVNDLIKSGGWNSNILDELLSSEGSVQNLNISDEMKTLYKTAFEIDQMVLIDMAIDRQPFIDQAQSLNLYTPKLTEANFNKWMFRAWKGGLKTGNYYIHNKPGVSAKKVTIDVEKDKKFVGKIIKTDYSEDNAEISFLDKNDDICVLCSG